MLGDHRDPPQPWTLHCSTNHNTTQGSRLLSLDERSIKGRNFALLAYDRTTVRRKENKWSRPKFLLAQL